MTMTTMRADLHVHTCHSRQSGTLRFLGSRDCYSQPDDVYRVAKARGMDLVCITDHDSIDGGLELLQRRPDSDDVIVGEEITCRLPDGDVEVHLGAYGMTEPLHRDVQHLRGNVFDVIGRLREAGVFFVLNHLLHFYRGQVPLGRYLGLLDHVPGMEARNGTMLPRHNALCSRILDTRSGPRLAAIGGSDAHTLRRVGTTWTEAPGQNREEFLNSISRGVCRPGGRHGSVSVVAGDAYGVVGSYVASLAGFGPRDLTSWRRAGCLAFAALSMPMQFMPLAVTAARKAAERRSVERAGNQLFGAASRAALSDSRSASPESRLKSPGPGVPVR